MTHLIVKNTATLKFGSSKLVSFDSLLMVSS